MKACAIMTNGELAFTGQIELSRFMVALKMIGSKLTSDEIWTLASKSFCGSLEEEEGTKQKFISF
jgi:hypothetical protein